MQLCIATAMVHMVDGQVASVHAFNCQVQRNDDKQLTVSIAPPPPGEGLFAIAQASDGAGATTISGFGAAEPNTFDVSWENQLADGIVGVAIYRAPG